MCLILLIEDSPVQTRVLAEKLSRSLYNGASFEVLEAPSLSQGLQICKERCPEAVVLDLGLPDSDGICTFLSFRESCPNIPVIVCTSRSEKEIALRCLKEGAQDFVYKSDVDMLAKTVWNGIERSRYLRVIEEREQQRNRLNQLYESILSVTPNQIVRFRADLSILYANSSFLNAVCLPSEEVIGSNFSQFLSSEFADELLRACIALSEDMPHSPTLWEERGSIFMEWTVAAIFDEHRETEYQAIGIDVTWKRIQTQRILETIESQVSDFEKRITPIQTSIGELISETNTIIQEIKSSRGLEHAG